MTPAAHSSVSPSIGARTSTSPTWTWLVRGRLRPQVRSSGGGVATRSRCRRVGRRRRQASPRDLLVVAVADDHRSPFPSRRVGAASTAGRYEEFGEGRVYRGRGRPAGHSREGLCRSEGVTDRRPRASRATAAATSSSQRCAAVPRRRRSWRTTSSHGQPVRPVAEADEDDRAPTSRQLTALRGRAVLRSIQRSRRRRVRRDSERFRRRRRGRRPSHRSGGPGCGLGMGSMMTTAGTVCQPRLGRSGSRSFRHRSQRRWSR